MTLIFKSISKMIVKLFTIFCRISPKLKALMWKKIYQFVGRSYQSKDWTFMNFGYAPVGVQTKKLYLDKKDENNRFCIQLYHHVVSSIDLTDLDVLEVGSGRGGGADYIKRHLKPKTMVGVDFSEDLVAFCKQNYAVEGLSFEVGNAESLPFTDNSFDVVVNVESCHVYVSMDVFLGQVRRVLRKGGYFLFADFRGKKEIDVLREKLHNSGLTLIKETDITPNVVEALNLDNERKSALIKKRIHKQLLVQLFLDFTGSKSSGIYKGLQSGEVIYLSFVLQKRTD